MTKGKMDKELLKRMLTGQDGKEMLRVLLNDFVLCASLMLLREYCERQKEPQAAAILFISAWRDRMVEQYNKEKAAVAEYRAITAGMLFAGLAPPDSEVDAKFQETLKEATAILEAALCVEMEAE